MSAVLDTSVLIGEETTPDVEAAISVASITELHFGVLMADDDGRARRADRLAAVEATFDPLPVTVEVARAWGRLAAVVEQVPLLTNDVADFQLIEDLVRARRP